MVAQKTVLITGCSDGGIGSALSKAFQARGFHVFATGRSKQRLAHLEALKDVTLLELDVTSSASIDTAYEAVKHQTGGQLDYLVNNAGVMSIMPSLDIDIRQAKELFDTNFWGVLAMVQKFSPLLISAKGCITNICSISGFINVPFESVYGASKAALLRYSETLRLELAPFHVRVLSVVTGPVATNLGSPGKNHRLPCKSLYSAASKEIKERAMAEGYNKMEAHVYADQLVKDMVNGSEGQIWRGATASRVRVARHLSPNIVDNLVSKGTGLDQLHGQAVQL
ncbi:putative hydroxybutyrate dehydrogenase [Aspergillus welwitschiae]|uniref:Putative hydroxybutyrate dehydrogenase n=1 Tax=Aspergillus welwitschiae TaxID=1341132 RepID=A0A3F3PKU3_9EURO|nr:putative hydroxybutyrate dehydrogenase [Aspergillus welwitschiae]RDH27537.1 putative hydroxybutyrate dehydrogenase [Aspergillus welwitschiae]